MYKINPNSYKSVFVMPSDIADKHLRMAGKAQLKVLLWLFRNAGNAYDENVISRDTGIPQDEISDAFLYWKEAGIVLSEEDSVPEIENITVVQEIETAEPKKDKTQETVPEKIADKPERIRPTAVKPSIKDIAARLSESPDIKSLFTEAQVLFGRTLGYEGQACLLMLHDYYGLPAEVITMICGYVKTIGKQTSLNYIMKIGETWAEEEITTFDKASEKIERLENVEKGWTEFKKMTGVSNPRPTTKQIGFFEIWLNDYKFSHEMINLAYEKTVEKKGNISFGYMNSILASWHEKGLKTTADVESDEHSYSLAMEAKRAVKNNNNNKPSESSAASYDIELAIQKSKLLDPTKTKRGE